MNISAKKGATLYQVQDPSWFEQYAITVSEPDDNAPVYDLLLSSAKSSDIRDEYNSWLRDHFNDYYFSIMRSGDDFYAVASIETRACFALEVTIKN